MLWAPSDPTPVSPRNISTWRTCQHLNSWQLRLAPHFCSEILHPTWWHYLSEFPGGGGDRGSQGSPPVLFIHPTPYADCPSENPRCLPLLLLVASVQPGQTPLHGVSFPGAPGRSFVPAGEHLRLCWNLFLLSLSQMPSSPVRLEGNSSLESPCLWSFSLVSLLLGHL